MLQKWGAVIGGWQIRSGQNPKIGGRQIPQLVPKPKESVPSPRACTSISIPQTLSGCGGLFLTPHSAPPRLFVPSRHPLQEGCEGVPQGGGGGDLGMDGGRSTIKVCTVTLSTLNEINSLYINSL